MVQQDHCEEGMYEYLPTAPQDTIDMGPVGYQVIQKHVCSQGGGRQIFFDGSIVKHLQLSFE